MKEKILALLLGAKNFVSGEEMSNQLGVSRTAIWKNIKKLKEEGYEIESITKKGYRILAVPDCFIKEEVEHLLRALSLDWQVFVYNTIDSTNSEAKRQGIKGVESGIFIAETQSNGMGRRGRKWCSKEGEGVFFSLLLRPTIEAHQAPLLTLLAGLAMQRAIEKTTNLPCQIKWPNDIVVNKKKVCGILTEMTTEIDDVSFVVVGIGINVNNSSFDEELVSKATSLSLELKNEVNRKELLANGIEAFVELYNQFTKEKTLEFVIDEYNKKCINIGKTVCVKKRDSESVGKCKGIRHDGALILEKDGEEILIHSGEVSVRGLYGYVD